MRCLQMVSPMLIPVIKWILLHCLKEEKKRKEDEWKKLLLMLEILDVRQILAVQPMNLTQKINRRQICLMTFLEYQGIRTSWSDLFILVCGCIWNPFGMRHFQWTWPQSNLLLVINDCSVLELIALGSSPTTTVKDYVLNRHQISTYNNNCKTVFFMCSVSVQV